MIYPIKDATYAKLLALIVLDMTPSLENMCLVGQVNRIELTNHTNNFLNSYIHNLEELVAYLELKFQRHKVDLPVEYIQNSADVIRTSSDRIGYSEK
jgi:hypothetical protein